MIPLIFGSLLIVGSIVALYFALGIFGEKESAAAQRLRLATDSEHVVAASAKLNRDETESFAKRFTPVALIDRIERNFMLAGRPEGWSVAKILSAKVLLGVGGILLGLLLYSNYEGGLGVILGLASPIIGYFLPDILINGKATRRQEEIQHSLPDLLDQILISIESGTSFEAALARSGQTGTGPLAEELVRTVQDVNLGMPRRAAYEAMTKRTDVEELRKFVRAITQGEEFGVPVSEIVREQAREMRVSRRLRAEAKANQIPVKMLLPLISTIMPVLFMIIIGPTVINAIAAFRAG